MALVQLSLRIRLLNKGANNDIQLYAFSIMAFSIMAFSIMAFSITKNKI
jgi:hypothetical protein